MTPCSHTFLSHSHIPFAIPAVVFVLFPALVVTLYPARPFQKFLNCCGISSHALHAFADAFNGCYKNGTNGKRDCRNFTGFYLFVRVVYITFYALSLRSGALSYCKLLSVCLFISSLASPYKSKLFNILDSFDLTLVALRLCGAQFKDVFNTIGIVYLNCFIL